MRLTTLLLAAGLIFAFPARAQDSRSVWLLVASPELQGPYRNAVMVIVPSEGDVVGGFILNRPSDTRLARLFPRSEAAKRIADPVNIGGPDGTDTVFAMARSARSPARGALWLGEDLYVVSERAAVLRIIARNPPEARYFAGAILWDVDQLEDEIEAGAWLVMEATPEILLRKDTESLWAELVLDLTVPQQGPPDAARRSR